MAEKMRTAEDHMLETMFQPDVIADNGFSERALRRIRRQLWVRRLALPVAMIIGTAIAARPALQLLDIGSRLFGSLAESAAMHGSVLAAQIPILLFGGLALALVMATFRLFEE